MLHWLILPRIFMWVQTKNLYKARNSVFSLNFQEVLDILNSHNCCASPYTALLVKYLCKLDQIWGEYSWKTTQSRSKMIAWLTFEDL